MSLSRYRAWDKANNKMISWRYLLNGHNLRNVFMRPEMCGLVLMQSTGLKGKNGVEIYEGDIVRHSKISTDISIVRFGEFGVPNIEEMEYQDMAVGFYFENASDLKDVEPFNMTISLNNLYVEGIEIIGNIYENPELLEGEK